MYGGTNRQNEHDHTSEDRWCIGAFRSVADETWNKRTYPAGGSISMRGASWKDRTTWMYDDTQSAFPSIFLQDLRANGKFGTIILQMVHEITRGIFHATVVRTSEHVRIFGCGIDSGLDGEKWNIF